MKTNMGVAAMLAAGAYGQSYFLSNVRTWDMGEIDFTTNVGNFVPTGGLKVSGEIAWHTHGSGSVTD